MITLTKVFIRLERDAATVEELEDFGHSAYETAEEASTEFLTTEVGVDVVVQEGTVETVVIIATAATALITAISNYGGFWEGLQIIRGHARKAGDFVRRKLKRQATLRGEHVISTRVTTGHLTRLDGLFCDVENGELSPSKAHRRAVDLLERAGEEVTPEMSDELFKVLSEVPVTPDRRLPPTREERGARRSGKTGAAPPRRREPRGIQIRREPGSSEAILTRVQ